MPGLASSKRRIGASAVPERTPVYTNRLQCVECGRVSREDERGWTARLTIDDEVVVFCPECDEQEFNDGP
jgi:hypothetical protein